MKNILIIGKNSFYYNQVKNDLKIYFNITEISHLDLYSDNNKMDIQWDIILIFARVKEIVFFNHLKLNYKSKKFILISSIILDLPTSFNFYSYYKEKYNTEKWFTSILSTNITIIRSGTIESDAALIYSKKDDLIKALFNLNSFSKIISLPLYKNNYKLPHLLYRLLFNLKYGYILLRPFDLFYKGLELYLYGYIYAIERKLKINRF